MDASPDSGPVRHAISFRALLGAAGGHSPANFPEPDFIWWFIWWASQQVLTRPFSRLRPYLVRQEPSPVCRSITSMMLICKPNHGPNGHYLWAKWSFIFARRWAKWTHPFGQMGQQECL